MRIDDFRENEDGGKLTFRGGNLTRGNSEPKMGEMGDHHLKIIKLNSGRSPISMGMFRLNSSSMLFPSIFPKYFLLFCHAKSSIQILTLIQTLTSV